MKCFGWCNLREKEFVLSLQGRQDGSNLKKLVLSHPQLGRMDEWKHASPQLLSTCLILYSEVQGTVPAEPGGLTTSTTLTKPRQMYLEAMLSLDNLHRSTSQPSPMGSRLCHNSHHQYMDWKVVIENKTVLECVEIHVCWCVCSFNLICENLECIVLETNKK